MKLTALLAATVFAAATLSGCAAKKGPEDEKVVYHINDAANARVAMRNVQNHLNANPQAKVVVVTHGKGIDFLLVDAKDDKGEAYTAQIAGLKDKGVDFAVCANTLKGRKLQNDAVILDAKVVPSGVGELGKLQSEQGYVYIKP